MEALVAQVGSDTVGARHPWLDVVPPRRERRDAIGEHAPDAVRTFEGLCGALPDEPPVFNDINGMTCWGAGAVVCRLLGPNSRWKEP